MSVVCLDTGFLTLVAVDDHTTRWVSPGFFMQKGSDELKLRFIVVFRVVDGRITILSELQSDCKRSLVCKLVHSDSITQIHCLGNEL